jgi:metal-responsive CopG/Arc/MetJ family transcriptional regulator
MRHYTFKIYPEDDPEVIQWLDSLARKRRSEEIRRALRAYINKADFVVRQRRLSVKAVNE